MSPDLNTSLVTHLPPSAGPARATRLVGGAVVCDACGCRLAEDGNAYRHYAGATGRDARGCSVECLERDHRVVA